MKFNKRAVLGSVAILATIFLILQKLKSEKILAWYSVNSTANSPFLEPGDIVFTSRFSPIEKNDFVVYERNDPEYGFGTYIFRLKGVGGDTIQMKKGQLFVNGDNSDTNLNLKYSYLASNSEFQKIKKIDNNVEFFLVQEDTYIIQLDNHSKNSLDFSLVPREFEVDVSIQQNNDILGTSGSFDNFSPVIVPKGKVFVLGDNRHNANDSRNIGFINQETILSKVIWKL
ncbi:signal peptidase I [Dokdonia sinensis]|uniref:signal peptidase I n=1 Tax=Dokdonia sinensis TaxID=2479847 RepID=UPI001374ADAC|nr:signal peptidase I [Dokdonia sinensis]